MLGKTEDGAVLHEGTAQSSQERGVSGPFTATFITPRMRKPHDPLVTFEENNFYAQRTRAEQEVEHIARQAKEKTRFKPAFNVVSPWFGKKAIAEKTNAVSPAEYLQQRINISDEERRNASRILRTTSWGSGFYLITTDIFGPYGVGFAMGTLGWAPGIILYTVFGFMAGYSGYLLYKTYMGLDSLEFPIRSYGDLAFRVLGRWGRHITNILQVLQLISVLGQVIIQNGQGISEIANFKLCYAVCVLIFVLTGFFLGQVRTLHNQAWLANIAVWLNVLVILITMGVIANSPPNYSVALLGSAGSAVDISTIKQDPNTGQYPAIIHYNSLPNPNSLIGSLNGLLQGVFAYGGAYISVEVMAEMRRPRDFFKSMWIAQFFIYAVYLSYGCFVYYFQGQYAYAISYQGVSAYSWQVVGGALNLVSGLIAAGLYGNIGIKVFYNSCLVEWFWAPPLTTRGGKLWYAALVPFWWSIAFIIAASILDYFGYVSVILAVCVVNICYTVPPLFALAYYIQKCAIQDGEGFDPMTGQTIRFDSGFRRWSRGFLKGPW